MSKGVEYEEKMVLFETRMMFRQRVQEYLNSCEDMAKLAPLFPGCFDGDVSEKVLEHLRETAKLYGDMEHFNLYGLVAGNG